jgi:CRISPR/Cas system-associated protein Cas7 (RAMP superfamily)
MAITQPAWSGPTQANPSSLVNGRKPSDNRQSVLSIDDKPQIESVQIFASTATPTVIVNIYADGKTFSFKGNRRTAMMFLRESSEAVFKTEPGK